MKKGKLSCVANASCGGKNLYSNFQKKKEGEANAIMGLRGINLNNMLRYLITKSLISHLHHFNSHSSNRLTSNNNDHNNINRTPLNNGSSDQRGHKDSMVHL